jgi:hypothetical protein
MRLLNKAAYNPLILKQGLRLVGLCDGWFADLGIGTLELNQL